MMKNFVYLAVALCCLLGAQSSQAAKNIQEVLEERLEQFPSELGSLPLIVSETAEDAYKPSTEEDSNAASDELVESAEGSQTSADTCKCSSQVNDDAQENERAQPPKPIKPVAKVEEVKKKKASHISTKRVEVESIKSADEGPATKAEISEKCSGDKDVQTVVSDLQEDNAKLLELDAEQEESQEEEKTKQKSAKVEQKKTKANKKRDKRDVKDGKIGKRAGEGKSEKRSEHKGGKSRRSENKRDTRSTKESKSKSSKQEKKQKK